MRARKLCLAATLSFAATAPPLLAAAQNPDCADLAGDNHLIGAGGSASLKLLGRVAAALYDVEPPIQLIYAAPGACTGFVPYVDGTTVSGTATYWDEAGAEHKCELPLTGVAPDFAMLGTSATLCEGVDALPAGIGDFEGPITAWSLLVPLSSSEQVISSEALYFTWGMGAVAGQVAPWTDPGFIYGRAVDSAALIAIALGAGVPTNVAYGNFRADRVVGSNGAMVTAAVESVSSGNQDRFLGFASTETVDGSPTKVRTLAYQHRGQSCGYLPDSTSTVRDRANVRDGHYYLWSPYHFYAPVGTDGRIVNADTRRFVEYFTDATTVPEELPLLDIIVSVGNVPECAMHVWRDTDIGPLYSFQPEHPCVGAFEFIATGATTATECEDSSDCTSSTRPTCRYGYCEVQ